MTKILPVVVIAAVSACGGKSEPNSTPTTAPSSTPGGNSSVDVSSEREKLLGRAMTSSIMAQWQRDAPDGDWQTDVRRSHPGIPDSADNSDALKPKDGQGAEHTYSQFTKTDLQTWKRETDNLVLAGARIFHSGNELGSTNGVSCDMCHPDASNTHPETYPKFQTQMGRVILLRDMINWCLINPAKARSLDADDPKMRALEAYIIAQRKGVKLEYGKH